MLKKTTRLSVLALLFGFCSITIAQTAVKVSTWYPPTHPGVTGGFSTFNETLKNDYSDEFSVKYWEGGSLLDTKGTLNGLATGVADIGNLAMTYYPGQFPYFQLIADMGMYSSNPIAVMGAVNEMLHVSCKECREEFFKNDVVYIAGNAITPYTMISKKPITEPDDLKGKKFRTPGSLWNRWASYVGGTSVDIPASEMFQALDSGAVDVALQP